MGEKVEVLRIESPTGELAIRLWSDGTSETGPDYNPDEAARRFWNAVTWQIRLQKAEFLHRLAGGVNVG